MKKFIPYGKLSKREQRAQDAAGRRDWGILNPVTRKPENPKAYRRAKTRREENSPPDSFFLGKQARRRGTAAHFLNKNSI